MNSRLGFESNDGDCLAKKEEELRFLKDNYELTMTKLKEK
jgi:hypothetical protein